MQKRIIFGVPEIKSLRIRGRQCDDEVVITPNKEKEKNLFLPHNCPGCRDVWSEETEPLEARMISLISAFQNAGSGAVELQFEIDGDEAA